MLGLLVIMIVWDILNHHWKKTGRNPIKEFIANWKEKAKNKPAKAPKPQKVKEKKPAKSQAGFCPNCGTPYDKAEGFCAECGCNLEEK